MSPIETAMVAVVLPLIGALGILCAGRKPNVREFITLTIAVSVFGLVLSLVPSVIAQGFWSAPTPTWSLVEMLPGLSLAFHVEPLGIVYALIASSLWVVNSIYAIGYMRANKEQNQTRFFTFIAIAISCALAAAFSANVLTLFVCYEALSLSTVPLVTHKGTPEAKRGGRTYLGILVGTSVCLFLTAIIGIAVINGGNLNFQQGGVLQGYLAGGGSTAIVGVLFAMCMYGIGKAALMPVHRWLPAAMVAPTPVSALLHAVAVVKCGVFAVLKVTVYIFGLDTLGSIGCTEWLVYMACFTILCASCIAAFQNNFKRRLAYSTVSQLGYIVLAAGLAAQGGPTATLAIAAGAMHILAHGFGKITLFYAAGNVYTAHHLTEISQLDGIGKKMPITFGAFAIGAISMIGIPPTAGFLSKWSLMSASWGAGQWVAVGTLICSTLLNSIYLLEIPYRAFCRAPSAASGAHHHDDSQEAHHAHGAHHGEGSGSHDSLGDHHQDEAHSSDEAPLLMRVAIGITAVGTIAMFIFASQISELLQQIIVMPTGVP